MNFTLLLYCEVFWWTIPVRCNGMQARMFIMRTNMKFNDLMEMEHAGLVRFHYVVKFHVYWHKNTEITSNKCNCMRWIRVTRKSGQYNHMTGHFNQLPGVARPLCKMISDEGPKVTNISHNYNGRWRISLNSFIPEQLINAHMWSWRSRPTFLNFSLKYY